MAWILRVERPFGELAPAASASLPDGLAPPRNLHAEPPLPPDQRPPASGDTLASGRVLGHPPLRILATGRAICPQRSSRNRESSI